MVNEKKWFIVDLEGKVLGRAASRVACILRGKEKPQFTPHHDEGDFVVAINASKIRVTGKKLEEKKYYSYSGYPGGLKSVGLDKLLKTKPEKVFKEAVKGMLPKNVLGRKVLKKLKIYPDKTHPHEAQQPKEFKI